MSCNGCRALRKACDANCVLRPCLDWIESPGAQGHATLYLTKFYGRTDFLNFISNAPSDQQRIALFRSLLYDAAGRAVNPINGAMGLLSTGNWHLCEAAVQMVLDGGSPAAPNDGNWIPEVDETSAGFLSGAAWGVMMIQNQAAANNSNPVAPINDNLPATLATDVASGSGSGLGVGCRNDAEEPKLLNLFE